MSTSLLAAALSAATNHAIIINDDHVSTKSHSNFKGYTYFELSQDNLHQYNLVRGRVETSIEEVDSSIAEGKEDDSPNQQRLKADAVIYVLTLTGNKLSLKYDPSQTIESLKLQIQDELDIPPDHQTLNFEGTELEENRLLADYKIAIQSTIHLVQRLSMLALSPNKLAPEYDYDFTNLKCDGSTFMRGDYEYQRPYGWNRTALSVLDKYGDNSWLGSEGHRTVADKNEWPVSYHGTAKHNCKSIAEDGFLLSKGKRFRFGHGIYSTPDIDVAEQYATEFDHQGNAYKVVFQNRVNPDSITKIETEENGVGEYWISPNEKDVRPYGICIKSVN